MFFFFFFVFFFYVFLGDVFLFFILSLFFLMFGVWGFGSFHLMMSFDFLSWSLSEMSILILILVFLGKGLLFSGDDGSSVFYSFFLFLMFFLFFSFGSMSWFTLYFFFECCILPTFFVILGWGFSDGRLQASFYFFFYTLFFSLPFFLVIFNISFFLGSLCIYFFFYSYLFFFSYFFVPFMLLIFLVKLPVFFLHVWLPKAHVEAPLPGSMVLAAVLLKLGSYGLYRLFMSFNDLLEFCCSFLYSLGLVGSFYASFSCFRQVDFKRMVAFMSVSHMGILMSGFVSLTFFGVLGSVFFMVGHGLVSSGLFGLVNFFYERSYSRSVVLLSGGMEFFSSFSLVMFLVCILNASFPPSLNFFSEVFLSWGIVFYSNLGLVFFFFSIMFGFLCCMHYYVSLVHGYGSLFFLSGSATLVDYLYFFLHLFWLMFSFFFYL